MPCQLSRLTSLSLATLLLVSPAHSVWADHHETTPKHDAGKQKDPLGEFFIPPELVMEHAQELGIETQTLAGIRDEFRSVQSALPPLQKKLQEEMRKLQAELESRSSDEEAVLAQLDRVLNQELKVKRLHVRLLYRIRQQLSESQLKALMKLKAETMARNQLIKERLQGKIAEVQKAVQQRIAAGQPPHEIAKLMQSFESLIKKGQIKAAEAILDQALLALEKE